jgi:predicted MarR family transcription regulator
MGVSTTSDSKEDILTNTESVPWHLGENEYERSVTRLELALFNIFESVERWEKECTAAVQPGLSITGGDSSLLHVIRMHDRPKGVSELAQFLNRDDLANIQYSIRKLQKLDLIQKSQGTGSRKDVTYEVTEYGRVVTDKYAEIRRKLLMSIYEKAGFDPEKIDEIGDWIVLLVGMYESASRAAMMNGMR